MTKIIEYDLNNFLSAPLKAKITQPKKGGAFMKCLDCSKKIRERTITCPNCGYVRDEFKAAEEMINSFASFDEEMRLLVRGLMIQGILTNMSCRGGKGHIKEYPWVEIIKDKEKLNRLVSSYNLIYGPKKGYWKTEKVLGGYIWLVPVEKNRPRELLMEQVSDFGWFLHQVRN